MEKTVAPVNVSPLIKAGRWGFLVAGIIYGRIRYNMLCRKRQRLLDQKERSKLEHEAKIQAERQKSAQRDSEVFRDLGAKITGD